MRAGEQVQGVWDESHKSSFVSSQILIRGLHVMITSPFMDKIRDEHRPDTSCWG